MSVNLSSWQTLTWCNAKQAVDIHSPMTSWPYIRIFRVFLQMVHCGKMGTLGLHAELCLLGHAFAVVKPGASTWGRSFPCSLNSCPWILAAYPAWCAGCTNEVFQLNCNTPDRQTCSSVFPRGCILKSGNDVIKSAMWHSYPSII